MENKVFKWIKKWGWDGENSSATTKQIAVGLKLTTAEAYKQCILLEKAGKLMKIGYRVKDGTEDVNYSNHHFNSLIWGII